MVRDLRLIVALSILTGYMRTAQILLGGVAWPTMNSAPNADPGDQSATQGQSGRIYSREGGLHENGITRIFLVCDTSLLFSTLHYNQEKLFY